jgi:hypothetical protein
MDICFGDIVVEQSYADFKDFGGVKFPTKITQSRAAYFSVMRLSPM